MKTFFFFLILFASCNNIKKEKPYYHIEKRGFDLSQNTFIDTIYSSSDSIAFYKSFLLYGKNHQIGRNILSTTLNSEYYVSDYKLLNHEGKEISNVTFAGKTKYVDSIIDLYLSK